MSNLRKGKAICRLGLLTLLTVVLLTGCKHDQSAVIIPPPCTIPVIVSFKNDIVPVFELSCDQPSCHSGTESGGRVDLETDSAYYNLFKSKLIDTLDSPKSQLYERLTSTTSSMPPGIYLDNCTIQTILIWIQQGAKNN